MIYCILRNYVSAQADRIDIKVPLMKKKQNREAMFSARKQVLNIGLVVLILVVTFVFLFNSLSDFNDPGSYKEFLRTTRWWILPLGLVCLVLSVLCEARNLGMILKLIGHRKSIKECTVYASSDLYFSAITPSATGGQPAAAYYMTKDGVPLSQSSAILVLNVSIYTLGLLVIGLLALFIRPDFYSGFDKKEILCFWLGIGFHGLLILACLVFMFSKRMVLLVGNLVIRLLSVLHIFKDRDAKLAAYRASIANYRACVQIIRENPAIIFRLLFYSVMQRVLLMPITYLTFLACGVKVGFVDTMVMQAYCTVGASAIPLPGAVGISETLFVDMFSAFPAFAGQNSLLMYVMILSRSVSGYLAIVFCGYITMSHHIRSIVRAGRTDADLGEDVEADIPEAKEIAVEEQPVGPATEPEQPAPPEPEPQQDGETPPDESPPDESPEPDPFLRDDPSDRTEETN